MKKILLSLCFIVLALMGKSQGLDSIYVEKYYVANAADHAKDPNLPVGAVTYRIYVALQPGYFCIEAYGWPEHTLTFNTTTKFFNTTGGSWRADLVNAGNLTVGANMLDSWLALGVVSDNPYYGITKSEDDGVNTIVNDDGILNNNDASAGIPLTSRDGLKELGGTDVVYDFAQNGITTAFQNVFKNNTSSSFVLGATTTQQWYSTTRPQGATATNRVLIAQITTDGSFHYELNVHIGKLVKEDVIESYYAFKNPIPVSGTSYTEITGDQYKLSGTYPIVKPTVSITAPANGANVDENQTVSITANASDADGSIKKVEFYINNTKVGESTSPYKYDWKSVAGSATITAIATDNDGNKTTSAPVTITVNITGNISPKVSLSAPVDGAQPISGSIIPITADASDDDGTIANVEFFVDGVSQGTPVTSIPYQINWTAGTVGNHIITAKATDDKGASTTSAQVSVNVIPNNLPTISITAPANNAKILKGTSFSIASDAADQDGTVANVEFFVDGNSIGIDATAPYAVSWSNDVPGSPHVITAKATDNLGAAQTSSAVTITIIENPLPTVSITAPVNNATFLPDAVIAISADAADDVSVKSVEFFVDGVSIGVDNTAPYTVNYTGVLGTHTLTAKATDNLDATKISDPVSIIVGNNLPPTVTITAPLANAAFDAGATIAITASAADDVSVKSVEFFVDGTTSLGVVNAAPYTANYIGVAGTHTLTAIATDNLDAHTTSASVSITVNNQSPTVSISTPATGTIFNLGVPIIITATAADADGTVAKVEFFEGSTQVGATQTTAPYTVSYTGDVAGTHTITAKATDDFGAVTTSTAVTIKVNAPPSISISTPLTNASLKVNKVVAITVDAMDADGTVSSVEFKVNGTSLGTVNAAPFTINWTPVTTGAFTLTAIATDNNGGVTTSPSVPVTIIIDGINDITSSASSFKVYPNPAKDEVTLEVTVSKPGKSSSYKIISMEGQVVIHKFLSSIIDKYLENINISSLPSGQYLIELTIDGSVSSQRIIKK